MTMDRRYVTGLGIVVAIVLLWMENPWFRPEDINKDVRTIATIAFWVLFIAVVALMFGDRKSAGATEVQVEGPAFARYLFSNTHAGLFWLPIRLFLGFSWLISGRGKATGEGWRDGGSALAAYWGRAVQIPDAPARPPVTYDWYRDFLNFLLAGNHE